MKRKNERETKMRNRGEKNIIRNRGRKWNENLWRERWKSSERQVKTR